MSASTREPKTPVMDDLLLALQTPEDTEPALSESLLKMFKTDDDSELMYRDIAMDRFKKARELFHRVTKSQDTSDAVFYRLIERTSLEEDYLNAVREIMGNIMGYMQEFSNKPGLPTTKMMKEFLENLIKENPDNKPKLDILNFLLREDNLKKITSLKEIEPIIQWFASIEPQIKSLSQDKFYGMNHKDGQNTGRIYGPGAELHNWGVNVAWLLAITMKKLPVRLITKLEHRHGQRRVRANKPSKPLMPSAFALEISIANKMGYSFKEREDGTFIMQPPTDQREYYIPSNGTVGDGIILSKEDQKKLYEGFSMQQMGLLLISMLKKGPESLKIHFNPMLSSKDEHKQIDLVHGLLVILKKDDDDKTNQVDKILSSLTILHLRRLKTLLETPTFNKEISTPPLLRKVNEHIIVKDLKIKSLTEDGERLREHISNICTGEDKLAKIELMNAFLVANDEDKNKIMKALTQDEKHEAMNALRDVINSSDFSDPKYNKLKVEFNKPAPKLEMVTYFQMGKRRASFTSDTSKIQTPTPTPSPDSSEKRPINPTKPTNP